uniref:TNFR-Cys domain-containing protein n=1 Tax=Tetradesmus obliquus TaxID=3088 RepID=A0A383VSD8_TETOB|eukprot:jgi/Sobl393_1/655/SZX68427.1
MTGQFFGFLAPGLMVCDVMVCAKQLLFTEYGVPLTRAAALMLTNAAATAAFGAGGQAGVVSPSSLAEPDIVESCAGYTTQSYRSCPTGQQCVSTYKPGSGVCDCGDCSAFTSIRSCEQGDIWVGAESCCFTCPGQPICGVCQTPCKPEFQKVEVIVGTLPTTPESFTTSAFDYTSTTSAINLGNNAQTVTVTFSFQQTLTATMTYTKDFTYAEKAVAEIGIPFLNKASVEFSSTQKFTTTDTKTETRTSTITYAL